MRLLNAANLFMAGLIASVAVSGCTVLAPQPDRAKYFVLAPLRNPGGPISVGNAAGGHVLSIGLGPITIPRYLDRPEVVTRVSETQLSVSDTNRWAEPLETSVSSVLRQDLSSRLATAQIIPLPWSREQQIDYRVKVNFHNLECTAAGDAVVEASWTIQKGADGPTVQSGSTRFTTPAGKDERSASSALSRGVAQVSSEIAQRLITFSAARKDTRPSSSPSS